MRNRLVLIAISTIICVGASLAQTATQSPYSILGLGELKFTGFNNHKSAGGTSISLNDQYSFSAKNPATYANMSLTGFVTGTSATIGRLQSATTSSEVSFGNFDNFALVFPFVNKKPMAVSFGAYQYSQVGYDIINRNNNDVPSNYTIYKGTGGINRVYLGYGIEVVKNLSIGANVNYNFGNISATKAKVYPLTNDYFSFSDQLSNFYKGFDLDLGLQYNLHQKDSLGNVRFTHTLGATFTNESTLKGNGFRYSESFFGTEFEIGNVIPIDTLLYLPDQVSETSKPMGFGFGYTFAKGEQFSLSLETEMNMWSGLNNNLNNLPFYNSIKYNTGVRFIPKPDYSTRGGYFKKVRYSAGFRYENLYYNFTNQQLNELGISFGLGLPIVKTYRDVESGVKKLIISRINVFAEYSTRGTTDNGLIQEDYINLGIGLNLNDKWFQKNKYR